MMHAHKRILLLVVLYQKTNTLITDIKHKITYGMNDVGLSWKKRRQLKQKTTLETLSKSYIYKIYTLRNFTMCAADHTHRIKTF